MGQATRNAATTALDALLRRFGSSEPAAVLGPVADGQVNKAISLFNLKQWEESIEVCEGLLERFGEYSSCRLLGRRLSFRIRSSWALAIAL